MNISNSAYVSLFSFVGEVREGYCDTVSFVGLRSTTKVKPALIPVAAFTSNKTAGRRKKATQKLQNPNQSC